MKLNKIYTAIFIISAALFLYRLYWLFKSFSPKHLVFNTLPYILQNLVTLCGLAGVIVFGATKFKRTALLSLYFIIEIVLMPVSALYYYTIFSNPVSRYGSLFYLSLLLEIIFLTTACTGVALFTKQKQIKLHYIFIGSEPIAEFVPALKWKRFINYLTDTLLIIYALYGLTNMMRWVAAISERPYSYHRPAALSQLMPLFFYFLYYLVLEAIFKTTAGKALTNTMIVNTRGKTAGILQMIGRTFCRFVPFDGLSFLKADGRGWHDSFTDTYIVDAIVSEEPLQTADPGDLLSGYI